MPKMFRAESVNTSTYCVALKTRSIALLRSDVSGINAHKKLWLNFKSLCDHRSPLFSSIC